MSLDVRATLDEMAEHRRRRGEDAMDVALMTLVAFFEDAAIGNWLRDRVGSLQAKDPARVVVLDATQDEGTRRVEREWAELGVKGTHADVLQSAVASLALPQTPVVLIWGSTRIAEDARFARMAAEARVVVYNSSALDESERGLRALVEFVRDHDGVTMCDLAYLRLAPWQDCIALFFDGKNVIRELFDLRRVEITSGSAAEAYYLLGWLASRLEWNLSAPNRFTNRFGTEIEFSIAIDGPKRRIRRVALSSSQAQFVAELCAEKAEVISLTVAGAVAEPHRLHPIANADTASLIERAVFAAAPDRVFRDSLLAAGDVLARAERVER